MLKYIVIQLCDTSTSYCHYSNERNNARLIDYNVLQKAIKWAMMENLSVQFVYPDYELPSQYNEIIETIDHVKIKSSKGNSISSADVIVFNDIKELKDYDFDRTCPYILRIKKDVLFESRSLISDILREVSRLNIVITDILLFSEKDFYTYKNLLEDLSKIVLEEYGKGHMIQLNLLTDRMMLGSMNNCGAGDETITLAPDGKFYVCPAFYMDNTDNSVGTVEEGINIRNQRLYRLDYAPICRSCDAYHCHRCVWLNRHSTFEVNTPSHEQCVVSHIERNASKKLLENVRELGEFLPNHEIKEIDYLDPFDKLINA